MARAKNGQAISAHRRTARALDELGCFIVAYDKAGKLDEWRRGKAVLRYIEGEQVKVIAGDLDVSRGSVNRWLQWYEAEGVPGLVTAKAPGATPKLDSAQRQRLIELIEAGPMAAGYHSGVWTGPMIGDLIEKQFNVHYHKHTVPRLLHDLGFSLQRPRKRLARADWAAQEAWVKKRLPAIKKSDRVSCDSHVWR